MEKSDGYTRIEMLEWLKVHFENEGYFVKFYPKEFLPARVAMYCYKEGNGKVIEEIIIEPTVDREITKEKYFSNIPIKNNEILEDTRKLTIGGASPTRFYRYYFPYAKIYFAYPDYCLEDQEFREFCEEKNVGLIKTSEKKTEYVFSGQSLFDELKEKIIKSNKNEKALGSILMGHFENNFHYLVLYPDPKYQRSALIEKKPGRISQVLIDKIQNLENIKYSESLKKLSVDYRNADKPDYEVVFEKVSELWKIRLGLKYPEIHMHLEEILLRDNKYRDHFVHQFQVFLIGAYILDRMYKIPAFKKIISAYEKKNKCSIEDIWLAASTYHDFNYGLQNFDDWLLRYFSDTLFIKNFEAKEKLNSLNLDAAMIRESLAEIISKMVNILKLDEHKQERVIKFFYEKASRDRNHGVLSALSLLKLYESQGKKSIIGHASLVEAALSIACHDEDVWEALCGCKGYLKQNVECDGNCDRRLFKNKEIAISKQNIISERSSNNGKCELWESEVMKLQILKEITFNKYPIIFLLIFCDTIQEEGRVTSLSYIEDNQGAFKDFKLDQTEFNDFFSYWSNSNKRLSKLDENPDLIASLKLTFNKNGCKLSDDSIIYPSAKPKELKWKIVDKKLLYEIREYKSEDTSDTIKPTFLVKKIVKECYLNKVDIDEKAINIELIVDGIDSKVDELARVSCALNDKRFKVFLQERDTNIYKRVIINGNGGQ